MARKLKGGTILFDNVGVKSFGCAVGKKEGEGPLGKLFDFAAEDDLLGQPSWEKAESEFQRRALQTALERGALKADDVDLVFAGDLLNQCIGSTFSLRDFHIPTVGLFGACSTMSLALTLAAISVDGGAADVAAAVTSSHFCTAERQFRQPVDYGSIRTPTSQWTVTGAGAVTLSKGGDIKILSVTPGKIVDLDQTDANNMGAAMAPAAADTIERHLLNTSGMVSDYDLIVTGDLGKVGSRLLCELLRANGVDLADHHRDCGMLIFDEEKQDVHAGGSGCGCSASVLCAHLLPMLKNGIVHDVLFCATGALMSTTSSQQGESIPGICHAVHLHS